jgi:cytochrome c oxidase subunit 2
MAVAILLIVLVVGTVIFHFASPWWFTEIASNWGFLDTTVDITFWVTGIVYILLNGFLIWVVIKYRHREGQRAHYEPESHKLEWWLTAITTVGVIAMLAPGLWVWSDIVTVPEDAAEVEVLGRQWNWSYRFPGEDGTLGRTDISYMNADNPFGMDPNDPAGQDDVLAADAILHLPKDQPVKMLLRSTDVLHNFTVPQFRVKMDLVPGMVTYQWLTPIRTGTFDILCEELCGIAHYTMRGKVVVDEVADFEQWLATQPTFAETEARPDGDPVAGQAAYAVCSACHGANGEGNQAMNAPKLAGQQGWYLEKQLNNYKTGLRGAHEDDVYGRQMAPMAATLVDQAAIDNVIAYIESLPNDPAPQTISGNPDKGAKIYANCKVCHGENGEGIWALKAPRVAGASDWYMANQLGNYQSGIRGAHPADLYGKQMSFMAKIMKDEEAVNDVLAYINTLK